MIIDCKTIAQKIKNEIAKDIKDNKLNPSLLIVRVGNDSASQSYVKGKVKDCEEVGITARTVVFDEQITEDELIELLKSDDVATYSGVIVQLPLPSHINKDNIINAINPIQDVDGFRKDSPFIPCTPAGIMKVLEPYDLTGKDVLVINRSDIVGRPLVNLLLDRDATVHIAHSKTEKRKLIDMIATADIVITAVGKPDFFRCCGLKENAVVIDVSINRNNEGKLCGDLQICKCSNYDNTDITPVPGGIGLMTRAMLLSNTLEAYKMRW